MGSNVPPKRPMFILLQRAYSAGCLAKGCLLRFFLMVIGNWALIA